MKPLKFAPLYKSVIWGGSEIAAYKNIDSTCSNIGESWEISGLKGHESTVSEGEFSGRSINDLIREHGADLMGARAIKRFGPSFPWILKIIDAHADLSVQVHPDDDTARDLNLDCGKTEMWHIIKALPDAKIYAGFKNAITHGELLQRIADNSILQAIATYPSQPGDTFYLPAGTVHAIGAGNLILEIQQASDITYRLYDYDRKDTTGSPRTLHTAEAARVLNYSHEPRTLTPPQPHGTDTLICDSPYFRCLRIQVDGRRSLLDTPDAFRLLFVLDGAITLTTDETPQGQHLTCGSTILIPASASGISLQGDATIILATI